jgi:exoribonuclease II
MCWSVTGRPRSGTSSWPFTITPTRRRPTGASPIWCRSAWQKAVLAKQPSPYGDAELDGVARNCTLREDAERKVARAMNKRIAAVAMHSRIGEVFPEVVTGVTPKGTFVRALSPPVEGRLMRGEHGLDVGDQIRVKLLNTDPARGFTDFGRS